MNKKVVQCLCAFFVELMPDKVVARALKRQAKALIENLLPKPSTSRTMERLYAEIAEVKEPFDRDNLWRMFAVWAVLEAIQFGLAPTRRNT
jgi:hypothetical protein